MWYMIESPPITSCLYTITPLQIVRCARAELDSLKFGCNANKQHEREQEKPTENPSGVIRKYKSFPLCSYCIYIAIEHNMWLVNSLTQNPPLLNGITHTVHRPEITVNIKIWTTMTQTCPPLYLKCPVAEATIMIVTHKSWGLIEPACAIFQCKQ